MEREILLEELISLCQDLINSADNTGCSEDLTVVEKEKLDLVEDFIVNFCEN